MNLVQNPSFYHSTDCPNRLKVNFHRLFLFFSFSRKHIRMAKLLLQRYIPHKRKLDSSNADDLRVIGAGLPRTGTSSLKAALEILGFGPCHHMAELIDKPDRSAQFARALGGEKIDFHTLMKGYGSTLDEPTTSLYKEIHRAYPKAKIILSIRDSGEKWYESWENSVKPIMTGNWFYFSVYLLEFLRLQCVVCRKIAKKWAEEDGGIGPWTHDRHNARVIRENDGKDLLVFNVKEGWSPLCKFLEVDIPDVPFPNVNDARDMQRIVAVMKKVGWGAWGFLILIISVATYFLLKLTS